MSARRLAVLVQHLPPESATVALDRARHDDNVAAVNHLPRNTAPRSNVRCLEDLPVVSPGKAMRLVNASDAEFNRMVSDEAS